MNQYFTATLLQSAGKNEEPCEAAGSRHSRLKSLLWEETQQHNLPNTQRK